MQLMIGTWHIVGNEPMCFIAQIFFTKFCGRQNNFGKMSCLLSLGSLCIESYYWIYEFLDVYRYGSKDGWPQTEDDDQLIFNYSLATGWQHLAADMYHLYAGMEWGVVTNSAHVLHHLQSIHHTLTAARQHSANIMVSWSLLRSWGWQIFTKIHICHLIGSSLKPW